MRILSEEELQDLYSFSVLNKDKQEVPFKTLVSSEGDKHRRNIVILIRHFFCGNCEEYVRALSASEDLSPERLGEANPSTNLSIIGCGDPALIADYMKRTNCRYEIYTDPKRKIYDKLGCVINIGMGDQKPKYIAHSYTSIIMNSLWTNLSAGSKALSGGKASQNGGEFIWIDGKLEYARRMANTVDHLEVDELRTILANQASKQ